MIALAQYESNQSKAPSTKASSPSGAGRERTLKLCQPVTPTSTPAAAPLRATAAEHALRVAVDRLIDAATAELRTDLAAKRMSSKRPH
jgi:hypothetical protein